MKYIPSIIGGLLGLLFIFGGVCYFLNLIPEQAPPPPGSLLAMFAGAFFSSGYMSFVKVFEIVGGVLVAIPRTRNLGLLVLGPIVLNILAFHIFIMKGEYMLSPVLIFVVVASLYLLWSIRKAFAHLTQPD